MVFMTPVHNSLSVVDLVVWALVTPVQFYIGRSFFVLAWKGLKHGYANMCVVGSFSVVLVFPHLLLSQVRARDDRYTGGICIRCH